MRRPADEGASKGAHQTEQAGPSHPSDQSQVPASAAVPVLTEVRPTTTEEPKVFLKCKTYYPTTSKEERRKKRKKRVDAEVERMFTKIIKGKGTKTEEPKKKKGALFDPTKIVAKKLEFREPAEETRPSEDHPLMLAGLELLPVEAFHKLREDLTLQAEYQNFKDISSSNSENDRSDIALQQEGQSESRSPVHSEHGADKPTTLFDHYNYFGNVSVDDHDPLDAQLMLEGNQEAEQAGDEVVILAVFEPSPLETIQREINAESATLSRLTILQQEITEDIARVQLNLANLKEDQLQLIEAISLSNELTIVETAEAALELLQWCVVSYLFCAGSFNPS